MSTIEVYWLLLIDKHVSVISRKKWKVRLLKPEGGHSSPNLHIISLGFFKVSDAIINILNLFTVDYHAVQ